MRATWLTGATGMLTLVVAVMLMAYSAPSSHAQQPSHLQLRGAATASAVVSTP
jgi:hypothetical protein